MYTNWDTIRQSRRLYPKWGLSFEDWMDVMEYVSKKWGYEEPWKETRHWNFKGDISSIDTLVLTHKKTGELIFDGRDHKLYRLGAILL